MTLRAGLFANALSKQWDMVRHSRREAKVVRLGALRRGLPMKDRGRRDAMLDKGLGKTFPNIVGSIDIQEFCSH